MWDMDTCCGFAAAALSILAFGSFAVPIKCQAARRVSVDPLGTTTHGDNVRNTMEESSRPPSCAFSLSSLAILQDWHLLSHLLAGPAREQRAFLPVALRFD
jgi:hypothetical protein